jgi:hypothetical protein
MAGSTDFPVSLDSLGSVTDAVDDVDDDHVNDLRRAVEAIEAKVGIDSSAVTSSLDYLVKNFIATGRAVWIYEDGVAPTGWTLDAAADVALGCIGGAQAYNPSGGMTAGSWTQPDHTLTLAECPTSVKDRYYGLYSGVLLGSDGTPNGYGVNNTLAVNTSGSGNAHNHGTTYRPAAALGQIIVKS